MLAQDELYLEELRDAFFAYTRSHTKANKDNFRKSYLNYIKQRTTDLSLTSDSNDLTFVHGDLIDHVFNTMTTELRPCYTSDSFNQYFSTAVLVSIPYQYRKVIQSNPSPECSNCVDTNTIDPTILSHTNASIAQLMLFFAQTLIQSSDVQISGEIPEKILNLNDRCPLSLCKVRDLEDPIIGSDRYIYSEESIKKWLEQPISKGLSPLTRQILKLPITVEQTRQHIKTLDSRLTNASQAAEETSSEYVKSQIDSPDQSMLTDVLQSAASVLKTTVPEEIKTAINQSLVNQLGEKTNNNTSNSINLMEEISRLKKKVCSNKLSYLILLQSSSIFSITAQFAHLVKYKKQLTEESLKNFESSVEDEVSRYRTGKNIEQALCVFSPVREEAKYQTISDSPHQLILNINQ